MANTTNNNLSSVLNSPLIMGIALIIIGVLFCALQAGFVSILLTVVGVVLIILGALALVGRNWALGLIEIAIGVIIIACGWTIVDITLLILGIVFIAYAIYQIIISVPLLKNKKPSQIAIALLNPIFTLALGIILVVAKWQMIDVIFIVIGALAIVAGIMMIVRSFAAPEKSSN